MLCQLAQDHVSASGVQGILQRILKRLGIKKHVHPHVFRHAYATHFDTIERGSFIGMRNYAVYALMYQIGLRVGEVFRLNLDSINFDQKIITVIGKGQKRRQLHLTTFASHLNDEEVDILVIQSLMGHSTPRSTNPYIHPSLKRVREAMEKLPGVIYMNKLIASGQVKFQSPFYPKRQ